MKSILTVVLSATVLVGGLPAEAGGDIFATSNGRSGFDAMTRVLDTRAAQQYANSVRLTPRAIALPGQEGIPPGYGGGSYRGEYLQMARDAAQKYGIPEDLFLRLVQQESGWKANAESKAGALGLAQLMPDTARRLGGVDPLDPRQNLEGGARYLKRQYDRFGSWRLALAAYNAGGPEAVVKYDGIPPYRETQGYVKAILGS